MAFALLHNNKWHVDFTDGNGRRQRRIVGDGKSKAAATSEAALIDRQLRELRADHTVPNVADVAWVIERWLSGDGEDNKGKGNVVSRATFKRYEVYARHWKQFFVGRRGVTRFYMLTEEDVEAYRDARVEQLAARSDGGKQARLTAGKTVGGELTALRQLCNWAQRRGYHANNPAVEVKKPDTAKNLPYAFSREHQMKLLEASWGNPKWHLMICLGRFAGLRRQGICELKVEDVNLVELQMRVCEKGTKERMLRIHPQLMQAFKRYPAVSSVFWFGPMKEQEQTNLSTELCGFIRSVTGLKGKRARFHNLRHTFAKEFLRENPKDIYALSKAMGHSSVKTTEIYLSIEDEDLDAAIGRMTSPWSPSDPATPPPIPA